MKMGIPVGGRSLKEVRDQTERISRCRLTFEVRHGNRVGMANQNIMESAIFFESADPAQGALFAQHACLRTISVASRKGGQGKSFLTRAIAVLALMEGKSAGIIDTDHRGLSHCGGSAGHTTRPDCSHRLQHRKSHLETFRMQMPIWWRSTRRRMWAQSLMWQLRCLILL